MTREQKEKAYKRNLKELETLQNDLMEIEDYSEIIYQLYQSAIEELEFLLEEGEY